jgi:hypothetical protein
LPSQRAAVAVETASFNEHGGDRGKESFKVQSYTLNEVAEASGIGRQMIVWAGDRGKENFKVENSTLKDIEASQRATAKMLGVDPATVNRDLRDVADATLRPDGGTENGEEIEPPVADATTAPAWFQDDVDPAP